MALDDWSLEWSDNLGNSRPHQRFCPGLRSARDVRWMLPLAGDARNTPWPMFRSPTSNGIGKVSPEPADTPLGIGTSTPAALTASP